MNEPKTAEPVTFVSVWKKIGAFVAALIAFSISVQVFQFLASVVHNSTFAQTNASTAASIEGILGILSLVGSLYIGYRAFVWLIPSAGKGHKSFRLTQ